MAGIEEILDRASSRIKEARVELRGLLPESGVIKDFGPAYTAALFGNFAANLRAVEVLIGKGLTSSAAVVLRTTIFAAIRLAWLADAETTEELNARVVAFQKSSLEYERGLIHKARKSGGNPDEIEQLSGLIEAQEQEIQDWKSKAKAGSRPTDELKIAEKLDGMAGLITAVAFLDQHAHLNRTAINATLSVDPGTEQAVVISDRPEPSLVPVIVTSSMQALAFAAESFLRVIGSEPGLIEEVRSAGQRWAGDAVDDARIVES